jgi:hypothetical protein
MRQPMRMALLGAAAIAALLAVPAPAEAARRGPTPSSLGQHSSKDTVSCSSLRPKPGEYFLYYPVKRCRDDRPVANRTERCGNNRYTLFYGDKSEICRAASKARQGTLVVPLRAKDVVGAGGPAGATGVATMTVDPDRASLCYHLAYTKITKPTDAHIHKATAGKNGAVVVDLYAGRYEVNCVRADHDLLRKILRDPAGYYVDLHTEESPKGALRGQVGKAAGIRH